MVNACRDLSHCTHDVFCNVEGFLCVLGVNRRETDHRKSFIDGLLFIGHERDGQRRTVSIRVLVDPYVKILQTLQIVSNYYASLLGRRRRCYG